MVMNIRNLELPQAVKERETLEQNISSRLAEAYKLGKMPSDIQGIEEFLKLRAELTIRIMELLER